MKRTDLDIIGGPKEVAKICNISPSAVSMWFTPVVKNGLGGKIPYKHAKIIKALAACIGKDWSIDYIMGLSDNDI